MKSFAGKKIPATPAKAGRRMLISSQKQLEKISIKDGVPAFEAARVLHKHLEECIELYTQLGRLTQ